MAKVIKKILITLLILSLVIGGIYGGLILYRNASQGPVKVYSVAEFITWDWYGSESYTYGLVTTDKLQKVYASDSQTITEIYVTEGQEVKAGDPLLSYDTTLSDIDLEKAQISHQKLLRSYELAKKELAVIEQLQPHRVVVIKAEPVEISYIAEVTPAILSGSGSFDDPFYCLFSEEDALTDAMIGELCERRAEILEAEKKAEEETGDGDTEESEEPGESVTPGEESEEAPEDTASGEESEEEPGETEEPEEAEEEPLILYAAFVTRDHDALNGMVTSEWGLEIERSAEGDSCRYRSYVPLLPAEVYEYEEQPEDIWQEYGSDYSAEEIASMKKAKEEELRDYEDQIRLSSVNLERLEQEISDSRVYAKIDGTVKLLRDPEECLYSGEAVLELSAGGGYYIEVSMGEYDLDTMEIGQTVRVSSWQTGTETEGTVCAIGTDPVESSYSWGGGSSHVSYYPFTVFVDESANLMENDYVDVYYSAGSDSGEDSWYLENVFIRKESGKSFVYLKGEDGLLHKKIIQTGKSLDGYYTEIRGGLTQEDRVAFPYGSSVKEGAATADGSAEDFYSMY